MMAQQLMFSHRKRRDTGQQGSMKQEGLEVEDENNHVIGHVLKALAMQYGSNQ